MKTNIGHTGSAAGVAGLLKTVLAIENGVIPPSLNYANPNPKIGLEETRISNQHQLESLAAQDRPRRAGVSSFGMGGTNAHVIVEQSPVQSETVAAEHHPATPVAWGWCPPVPSPRWPIRLPDYWHT